MQFALFYNKAGCIELKTAAAIHSFKRTGLEEKKGVKSKMAKDKMYGKTLRKNFARHEEIVEMPNLLALQKKSYQWFLDTGLREVFSDVASISNYAGNLELSFIDYKMDEAPKYDVLECKARDATYAAPLKVSVRLYNKETGEIKEQEIFMGDFPLMTDSGTFVINGAERVVVSQLVRSPGIYYGKEIDLKTDLPLLTSTVIPYRGAWLEYETDANEGFWVRIDKNRKLPITQLIRAIGFKTDAEILENFGSKPGYLGPVGIKEDVAVYADLTVANMSDFCCGANEEGYHYTGVNFGRDLPEPKVADLRNVVEGDASPDGKGMLRLQRGIEVGHVFYLGTKYSEALNATYLDENGQPKVLEMGCYGIGVTRLAGAAIEQSHDERGIIWPDSIAPFEVVICPMNYSKSEAVREAADRLYEELKAQGVDVILDDRDMRPGVMFADWELIGVPHRVVIGDRGLKNGEVEYANRRNLAEKVMVKTEEAVEFVTKQIKR